MKEKSISIKDAKIGIVISHPLKNSKGKGDTMYEEYGRYQGQWLVADISWDFLDKKELVILNLLRVDSKKQKKKEWICTYRPTLKRYKNQTVSVYGKMEEISYWRWKEKY